MNNNISVLYEDESVVVINKPVGLLVHESGGGEEETVVDWLLHHAPGARGVGEPGHSTTGELLERSGVVHRLDRDTSGILILAKTADAYTHLKAQFHDRLVKKEYRAFVYGAMRERWGTIDRPIGRSASNFTQRSAMPGAKGTLRPATTLWETIGTAMYNGEHFSYLKLKPVTGRTHQLRAHLRSIDRPIVGDTLYAEHMIKQSGNLEFTRLALHAHYLEIALPGGESGRFVTPLPVSFEVAADHLHEAGGEG